MSGTVQAKANLKFNAILLIFVIHTSRLGVGILGFQRFVVKESGQDAWISVIIIGLLSHISAFLIVKTLAKYDSLDLYGIHEDLYGRWLGILFNLLYIIYLFAGVLVVLRTYIEAVQAFIFPEIPTWLLTLCMLFLVIYGVFGGLRSIVGICFFSFFCSFIMLLFLAYSLKYAEWSYLFPFMEADLGNLVKGASKVGLTMIGWETIYFLYPYVKDKKYTQKYTQYGVLTSNLIFVSVMVITIVYFSKEQLLKTVWATLSLLKIIQFPFLERFEYVAIPIWLLVVLPNMLLFSWAASRGIKQVFRIRQGTALYMFCIMVFVASILFTTREQVSKLNTLVSIYSVYITIVYPVMLFIIATIMFKWKSCKKRIIK